MKTEYTYICEFCGARFSSDFSCKEHESGHAGANHTWADDQIDKWFESGDGNAVYRIGGRYPGDPQSVHTTRYVFKASYEQMLNHMTAGKTTIYAPELHELRMKGHEISGHAAGAIIKNWADKVYREARKDD